MSFYHFSQNNSGGSFDVDTLRGISHHVIVEADSESDAIDRAEYIGLYFDGEGDCSCCGDRWSTYINAEDEPCVYSTAVQDNEPFTEKNFNMKWIKGPEGYIHYKNGAIAPFWP